MRLSFFSTSPTPPKSHSRPLPSVRRPTLATATALALLGAAAAWGLTQSVPAPFPPPPPLTLRWLAPRRAGGAAAGAAAARRLPSPALPAVAICAIVRDQALDLPEWLAWHAGVGVAHAFLYDHASSPPLGPATTPGLAPFFRAGFLTLVTAPPGAGAAHHSGRAQLWAYDDCLNVFGRGQARSAPPAGVEAGAWARVVGGLKTTPPPQPRRTAPLPTWLAFIDVDEFIMPTGSEATNVSAGGPPADAVPSAVASFAAKHPAAGAWALNWVLFGSSGHAARPPAGTLASYTACLPPTDPENTHVKTLARVDATLRVGMDPHHFLFDKNASAGALNGRGQVVPGGVAAALGPASYDGLALHHYATKSRAEFGAKVERGSAMGNHKAWGWFESVNDRTVAACGVGRALGAVVLERVAGAWGV